MRSTFALFGCARGFELWVEFELGGGWISRDEALAEKRG